MVCHLIAVTRDLIRGVCAAPTALGKRLTGLPALPGWANFCRASGARQRVVVCRAYGDWKRRETRSSVSGEGRHQMAWYRQACAPGTIYRAPTEDKTHDQRKWTRLAWTGVSVPRHLISNVKERSALVERADEISRHGGQARHMQAVRLRGERPLAVGAIIGQPVLFRVSGRSRFQDMQPPLRNVSRSG